MTTKAALAFAIPLVVAGLSTAALVAMGKPLRMAYEVIVRELREAERLKPDCDVTNGLMPASLTEMAVWIVDASQILGGVIGPLLGFVLLRKQLSWEGVALYTLAFVGTVVAFLWFIGRTDPRTYHGERVRVPIGWLKRGLFRNTVKRSHVELPKAITPVVLGVVVANSAMGVLAAIVA